MVAVLITDTMLVPESVTQTSVPSGVAATAYGFVNPLVIAEDST